VGSDLRWATNLLMVLDAVSAHVDQTLQDPLTDVGDLSDVLPQHEQDVVRIIRSLQHGLPGGISELRGWLEIMERKSGFSKELTVRTCNVVAQCLMTVRPPNTEPSQESLQRAFVRMGGVRHVVNTMLLRLSDPQVVAACAELLATAVQGSPLAVEAIHADGKDLRLLLRAIERHASNASVAMQGCALLAHLCSQKPEPGREVAPPRAQAHRHSQMVIAEEGAIDLLVDILAASLQQVKEIADKALHLHNRALGGDEADVVGRWRKGAAPNAEKSIMKVKSNLELREAWSKLSNVEPIAARVQDAALQSLILLAAGNAETTRMLVGVLWCWKTVKSDGGKSQKAAPKPNPAKAVSKMPIPLRRGRQRVNDAEDANDGFELPQGEARCAMGTLEAFARAISLPAEVLQGHASHDRPQLAAKACRLILLVAEYHRGVSQQIHRATALQANTVDGSLRLESVPQNHRHPEAPFAALVPTVSALTSALRVHEQDATALTGILEALSAVRTVAIKSAPAGVQSEGTLILQHWQKVAAEAHEKDEFNASMKMIRQVLANSEAANRRMAALRLEHTDFTDGQFFTPRMQQAADKALGYAADLAGDVLAAQWLHGAPDRVQRRAEALASKSNHASSTRARKGDIDDGESSVASMQRPRKGKKGKGRQGAGAKTEDQKTNETSEWKRAIGYGVHDQEDFDLMWREPLTQVLKHSFSTPAMRSQQERGESATGGDDDVLDIQLVHSGPGRMKAKCVVKSQDRVHQSISDSRLKLLLDPDASSKLIGGELSKRMRRDGHLLPRYGMQVNMRRGRAATPEGEGQSLSSNDGRLPPVH